MKAIVQVIFRDEIKVDNIELSVLAAKSTTLTADGADVVGIFKQVVSSSIMGLVDKTYDAYKDKELKKRADYKAEKDKKEAEEKAKKDAEEKAKKDAEEKAKKETDAKVKKETKEKSV